MPCHHRKREKQKEEEVRITADGYAPTLNTRPAPRGWGWGWDSVHISTLTARTRRQTRKIRNSGFGIWQHSESVRRHKYKILMCDCKISERSAGAIRTHLEIGWCPGCKHVGTNKSILRTQWHSTQKPKCVRVHRYPHARRPAGKESITIIHLLRSIIQRKP